MNLSRLRDIVKASRPPRREWTIGPCPEAPAVESRGAGFALEGATTIHTAAGSCLFIERRYDGFHGDFAVSQLADQTTEHIHGLRWLARAGSSLDEIDSLDGRLIFLDIETTGLSGGAGTVAFLVGLGFFDEGAFRTQQFFLPAFAGERALLSAITRELENAGAVVTYNGKSFDLPVMETRWLFHRMDAPLADLVHVDLLHPARRLWRCSTPSPSPPQRSDGGEGWGEGCSLVALERRLLGVRRLGDVPGFEIPGRYFEFIRSGDARPIEPVLEHNRLDLVSLAALTALAFRLLATGASAATSARECVSLGRLYERAGDDERAIDCYRHAAGDRDVRLEALYRLALGLRRLRRYGEAAEAWREILSEDLPPVVSGFSRTILREAAEALAVHHEHRARNLRAARALALTAFDVEHNPRRREAIRYRLARLDRKLTVQQTTWSAASSCRFGCGRRPFARRTSS